MGKLKDVDSEALPMFDETADLFLKQHNGDFKTALKIALAYCSGHCKQVAPNSSLLTKKKG